MHRPTHGEKEGERETVKLPGALMKSPRTNRHVSLLTEMSVILNQLNTADNPRRFY